MTAYGKSAIALVKELDKCTPLNFPPYNVWGASCCRQAVVLSAQKALQPSPLQEDKVQEVIKETSMHSQAAQATYRSGEVEPDAEYWASHPEISSAVFIHHECMLRNKRCLVAYLWVALNFPLWLKYCLRRRRLMLIKELRWQQSCLTDQDLLKLSSEEKEWYRGYDRLLTGYFRSGTGVGLDLTLESNPPPRSLGERVRVLRDAGELEFSVGSVRLQKGDEHYLPDGEVDALVRQGVLEKLDP